MPDDLATKLHSTTDAMIWAEEFCSLFHGYMVCEDEGDGALTVGTMVGWFANAMAVAEREAEDRGWRRASEALGCDGSEGNHV